MCYAVFLEVFVMGLDFPQAKLRVVATVMFYMQAGTIW